MIKILLVDDEHHILNHITTLLNQIDFCEISILQTTSGSEALQFVTSVHIDIAFLDINIPKISGLQIADKLHSLQPNCRIVFLTAYEVFNYIYEANQYSEATYLLKSESDAKILDVAINCCRNILRKAEEKRYLNNVQKKEKLLLLLQEQQLLREIVHENWTGSLHHFVQNASLEIHFSFKKQVYLMLMHVRHSSSNLLDSFFFLEKMEDLLGHLFLFSFVETEKRDFLWIFQEKDNSENNGSCFDYLKDTLDSFLDSCSKIKHYSLSLYLYQEQVVWDQIAHTYHILYDSYYQEEVHLFPHDSVIRVLRRNAEPYLQKPEYKAIPSSSVVLTRYYNSLKQALFQRNDSAFFLELQHCQQHCTTLKSMHHVEALKTYFSIALIYMEYIELYKLEPKVAMKTSLYPLCHINVFSDWEKAFLYLRQLGEVIFKITSENDFDKTSQLVASIQNYIKQHLSQTLNLTIIANYVNYNESHVSRLFKRHTGSNLSDYITACRVEYAKSLLIQTNDTVQVISQKAGFNTSQYFSSCFRKITGMSPIEYRFQNQT